MGQEITRSVYDASDFARFQKNLQDETALLGAFAQQGGFSDGRFVAGFELEAWLLDRACTPVPINKAFLERLNDPLVVPELSRYNVEVNGPPQPMGRGALPALEAALNATWQRAQDVAHGMDAVLAMIGIPPTLNERHLSLEHMSAVNRFRALNEQVFRQREGRPLHIHIEGSEPLSLEYGDVMLEAATTSFQVHFQVPEACGARYFNASLIACAPLLACCTNSPLLFGRRLWQETRIPLFEQSVDLGGYGGLGDPSVRRVTFGRGYVDGSMFELFRDNLDSYPVLLPAALDEPADRFPHVRLHNGSIWRWVRPLIGFDAEGRAHVRIEQRVLPSGPTPLDMLSGAAFYYGLVYGLANRPSPPEADLPFETARQNFYRAARLGLEAEFIWLDGERIPAARLVRALLPLAEEGLGALGLAEEETARYLGVLEARLASGQTGAVWQLRRLERLSGDLRALMADYLENQRSGAPVHEWAV